MDDPPQDYHICECCGTEFEASDRILTYDELRTAWIERGCPWFFGYPPRGWNPKEQLRRGFEKI